MNLTEDTIMNDANSVIITPPSSSRRFGRYREHMAQQPRSVSLRDFGSLKEDAPVTPPSSTRSHPFAACMTNPPEVPRHGRPINRRLLLSEAQERLSLPDLFAPRTTAASLKRRVRPLPQHPSLVPLQPRLEQWGDYEIQGHSMSQRSFFNHTSPSEF